MNKQTYQEIIDMLTEHRKGISEEKRVDYTRSSEDVLANFKNVAESTGVTPLQVWLVYTQKHFDAIANYVKTEGQSESEPIKERFGDLLNYAELGWALVKESQQKVPKFYDTPNACYYDGCSCDRTDKFPVPIEHDEGYIVDQIREYEDGYEVCSGDKWTQFKNEQIKGAYFNRMGTPKKLEVDDGRIYKIEEELAGVESVCDEKYKLCYVEGDLVFFTNDFENQWGDDWNDAPYEHNAGTPYNNDDNIVAVEFEGNFVTPNYSYRNSPYSVKQINDGDVWWLYNRDNHSQLYAGATIEQFKDFIEQNNGEIVNGEESLKSINNSFSVDKLDSTGRSAGI